MFYKDDTRFPESGWLRGTPADLADIARLVSVPQSAVDAATDALQSGIDRAAAILKDLNEQYPAITQAVAALLGMSDVPQTHRMACAIIANAMVFHDRVADIHGDIKPLRLVCSPNVANPQREIIAEWTRILAINYWPIFAVSRDIIEQIPTAEASRMLRLLEYTAGDVAASGANVEHDLTGRIFQRLIADRKYLATFYTLPASAALLARLAVDKLTNSTTKTPSPSSPPATPATSPATPATSPATPATSPDFTRHSRDFTRHSRDFTRHSRDFTRHSRASARHSCASARHSRASARHSCESRNPEARSLRLVRPRRHRQPTNRRLRLRHRRAAVRRL